MAIQLNPEQIQTAQTIYQIARQQGIPHQRAVELVAASYAESGLNPTIRNKSSGAAGLFQLLSPGYVNRATQLGGVDNPRANTMAILPDYKRYWQQHPTALPGEAGRDVERSGEGAGFYSGPIGLVGGLPYGQTPAAVQQSVGPAMGGIPSAPPMLSPLSPRAQVAEQ